LIPLDTHPAQALWRDPAQGLVAHIARLIETHRLHPARTVVLVPYAQLMGVARSAWAGAGATGFMPRFETTRNWVRSAGAFSAGEDDIAFDMARDLLTAQSLLDRSGFAAQRMALAGRLVEIAHQLAPLAAARLPDERSAWASAAEGLAGIGADTEWFGTESALNRIALAWAAHSGYATDVLLRGAARAQADALIVLEGLQADPLTQRLAALFGPQVWSLPLALDAAPACEATELHAAADPEDEAERAAACVLRRLAEGRAPVALVATDRALARRIGAQLLGHGVALHDETGWKLSTTRAAASLMTALRACARDAGSDAVLDWLKNAPAFAGAALRRLEARLRERGLRDWLAWRGFVAASTRPDDAALQTLTDAIEAQRGPLAQVRALPDWLAATRALLQASGQWPLLAADAAGSAVIAALDLDAHPSELRGGRCTLAEFAAWVREVLEAASAVLGDARSADEPQVVVLPLHQLLGRRFGAVVVPGCDDQRLPLSPEPPGEWSATQRAGLGLPLRASLEAAQAAAWGVALQAPRVDLLWRRFDASGEPVRPSPLVQRLRLQGAAREAQDDPRIPVRLAAQPTPHPLPRGRSLPLAKLSATGYEDLRRCPYRFFALRQLGLRSSDELDAELDKRDFGTWLHAVLSNFHEALKAAPTPVLSTRLAMISIAEKQATRELALSEAEFLPFAAAWPAVRDGYLAWLAEHEAREGAMFDEAEQRRQRPVGVVTLDGRLDRIDRLPDGRAYVIDYKTESYDTTRERVQEPTEDTQLAFYAALLDEESLRAAYVNVGEKASGTRTVEQVEIVKARNALLHGIAIDLQRIAGGAALPALGEGAVCTHCAARGLCRKDFWEDEAPRLFTPGGRVTPPPEGEARPPWGGPAAAGEPPC
jgi:ATP-dependent helicase/nuclease subunit B